MTDELDEPVVIPKDELPKGDPRAAIEWAWVNYDRCVIRNDKNIAIGLDFEKASSGDPPGGKQFLDLAFTNKVSFYKDFVMKALGGDIEEEDDLLKADKKSIKELKKLLLRFEEAGQKQVDK